MREQRGGPVRRGEEILIKEREEKLGLICEERIKSLEVEKTIAETHLTQVCAPSGG